MCSMGAAWHRGSIRVSYPAASGLILAFGVHFGPDVAKLINRAPFKARGKC